MGPRIAEKPFVDALTEIVAPQRDPSRNQSVGRRGVRVLGYSDRLIAVTSSSRNAASAFKLLEWLALPETSTQINSTMGGMLPVRRSMMSQVAWYRDDWSADDRAAAARTLEQVVSSGNYLMVPRIPGIDEYLEVLEEGIVAGMEGNDSPKAALEKVSQHWEQITDARGRDAQREAYLKHLGVSEP
jgi:ABC-type glycerol-3-phosphate transport system substrate-binding protein